MATTVLDVQRIAVIGAGTMGAGIAQVATDLDAAAASNTSSLPVTAIAEHLLAELGERFRPSQLLRRMVRAGKPGKKSGEGFYKH